VKLIRVDLIKCLGVTGAVRIMQRGEERRRGEEGETIPAVK